MMNPVSVVPPPRVGDEIKTDHLRPRIALLRRALPPLRADHISSRARRDLSRTPMPNGSHSSRPNNNRRCYHQAACSIFYPPRKNGPLHS